MRKGVIFYGTIQIKNTKYGPNWNHLLSNILKCHIWHLWRERIKIERSGNNFIQLNWVPIDYGSVVNKVGVGLTTGN